MLTTVVQSRPLSPLISPPIGGPDIVVAASERKPVTRSVASGPLTYSEGVCFITGTPGCSNLPPRVTFLHPGLGGRQRQESPEGMVGEGRRLIAPEIGVGARHGGALPSV